MPLSVTRAVSNTKYNAVNVARLEKEIIAHDLVSVAIDYLESGDGFVNVFFTSDLPVSEVPYVEGLIDIHDGRVFSNVSEFVVGTDGAVVTAGDGNPLFTKVG